MGGGIQWVNVILQVVIKFEVLQNRVFVVFNDIKKLLVGKILCKIVVLDWEKVLMLDFQ